MRRLFNFILPLALYSNLVWPFDNAQTIAQEMEVIGGGELEFQNHCVVCRGVDSKGQGIMSKFLTVPPADLTQIAKNNHGEFPFWRVYRIIDGQGEVRGHGSRDMPVWGRSF